MGLLATLAIVTIRSLTTKTFLFTDIEGSTKRWERAPADTAIVVERHFATLAAAVSAEHGTVFATMGDGVAAAFDSAADAVRAAVEAQRSLVGLGLAVRMGVHTGEAEPVGGDYRGRSLNRAARVMAMARGGEVLVSDVTAALVRSGTDPDVVDLVDAGTHHLRDLAAPERLWQVVHPDLEQRPPPLAADDTGLPVQRTSLVGRDGDIEAISSLLDRVRLVTLTGTGGVGKTRLALAVADAVTTVSGVVRFAALAELRPDAGADDVLAAITARFGVGRTADPDAAGVAVGAALGGHPGLLVLDNCEHVVDTAAEVVDELLRRCPSLSVLATSREALAIDGEHVVAVRPLDATGAAVELFVDRAVAAGAAAAALDRGVVARLCTALDGLPLAIELAAARTGTLGLDAVVEVLGNRAGLLAAGRRRRSDRHATLRATIEWSYRHLDARERRTFTWLAVFANGFELDAVRHLLEAMGRPNGDAVADVESLVAKSMVTCETTPDGARWRLLDTMRAFALEALDASGERTAARRAAAAWVATIAGCSPERPASVEVERACRRLEREVEQWRDAVVLAAEERSGDLAAALCGPAADFTLLGRHDLATTVGSLLEVCVEVADRRAVLSALVVSSAGAPSAERLLAWAEEVAAIDDADPRPTGLGGLMRWFALAWGGDFPAAVRVCVDASLDRRLHRTTRDLFVGIAVLDHFSLTDASGDDHALVPRAMDVAATTDVALARVTCLLGVAWALAERDAARSIELVRRALDDIALVPPMTRHTLPGSASRLLSRLDPAAAASALLDQLERSPQRRSPVELVPLFYGAALLERAADPAGAAAAPATVTVAAPVGPPSMMHFVDQARRAASRRHPEALAALEVSVRTGLRALATAEPRRAG